MKSLTILSAALVAAPMCMVAPALDEETSSIVNQMIEATETMASVLETVTPSTVNKAVKKLNAAKKKFRAAIEAGGNLTNEQIDALRKDTAINERKMQAQDRFMKASQAFQAKVDNASPEDQAKYSKVSKKLQSIFAR